MEDRWNECGSVTAHPAAAVWLESQGLDPRAVAARDLARADEQHLVLPLLDAAGRIADLQRIPVLRKSPPRKGKRTVPPLDANGLVMANLIGRALLFQGAAPDWWAWRTVVIVDDLIEFLTWGSSYGDHEDIPALFHVHPSGWTADHAARIPSGTRVIVQTGSRLAPSLVAHLEPRCEVVVRR